MALRQTVFGKDTGLFLGPYQTTIKAYTWVKMLDLGGRRP